jgi:hypothetical protein
VRGSDVPFSTACSIKIVGQEDFTLFVERIFATDRLAIQKGMIEVSL